MRVTSIFFACNLGVVAAYKPPSTPKGFCMTAFGTQSLKAVPTSTSTCTNNDKVYVTKTAQKRVTVTPKPSTKTTTSTSITVVASSLDAQTEAVQVVATEYETLTSTAPTVTRFSTVIVETSTTATSTSTVPAPDNFRPIQDTIEGSRMEFNQVRAVPKRGLASARRVKRDPGHGAIINIDLGLGGKSNAGYKKPPSFPSRVNCFVTVRVAKTVTVTKTKLATTITAPASTKIITDTKVITSINTVVPDDITVFTTSTTTSIIQEIVTPYTTVPTTSVSTSTVLVPGPTVYAVCQDRNFADSYNGKPLASLVPRNWFRNSYSEVNSALECCERCAALPDCAHSYAFNGGKQCDVAVPATAGECTEQELCTGTIIYGSGSDGREPVIFSNGRTFQWTEAEGF